MKIYWKCVEKHCLSSVTTNAQLTSLISLPYAHNHPQKESQAKRDTIKQKIIQAVEKEPTKKIFGITQRN